MMINKKSWLKSGLILLMGFCLIVTCLFAGKETIEAKGVNFRPDLEKIQGDIFAVTAFGARTNSDLYKDMEVKNKSQYRSGSKGNNLTYQNQKQSNITGYYWKDKFASEEEKEKYSANSKNYDHLVLCLEMGVSTPQYIYEHRFYERTGPIKKILASVYEVNESDLTRAAKVDYYFHKNNTPSFIRQTALWTLMGHTGYSNLYKAPESHLTTCDEAESSNRNKELISARGDREFLKNLALAELMIKRSSKDADINKSLSVKKSGNYGFDEIKGYALAGLRVSLPKGSPIVISDELKNDLSYEDKQVNTGKFKLNFSIPEGTPNGKYEIYVDRPNYDRDLAWQIYSTESDEDKIIESYQYIGRVYPTDPSEEYKRDVFVVNVGLDTNKKKDDEKPANKNESEKVEKTQDPEKKKTEDKKVENKEKKNKETNKIETNNKKKEEKIEKKIEEKKKETQEKTNIDKNKSELNAKTEQNKKNYPKEDDKKYGADLKSRPGKDNEDELVGGKKKVRPIKTSKGKAPKTGDVFPSLIFLTAILGLSGMLFYYIKKRKPSNRQNK